MMMSITINSVKFNMNLTSVYITCCLVTIAGTDNCMGNPCGPNGTCIDGYYTFTCICNEPWSGRLCQIPPNFCSDHTCANGASCINNIQYLNFTCVCADEYKGSLCQDKIGE